LYLVWRPEPESNWSVRLCRPLHSFEIGVFLLVVATLLTLYSGLIYLKEGIKTFKKARPIVGLFIVSCMEAGTRVELVCKALQTPA
jgi:hypothetical protein